MIAVMSGVTILGTSTKTGYRLARPLIPPKHPDLIEKEARDKGREITR